MVVGILLTTTMKKDKNKLNHQRRPKKHQGHDIKQSTQHEKGDLK